MDRAIAIWILVQWETGGLRKPFDKCWFGNPQSKFTLFITNKNQSSYSTNLYKNLAHQCKCFLLNKPPPPFAPSFVRSTLFLLTQNMMSTIHFIYKFNMGVSIVARLKPINNSYFTIKLCTNSLFNFLRCRTFQNVKRTWKLNIAFWPAKCCYSCGKNCWLN